MNTPASLFGNVVRYAIFAGITVLISLSQPFFLNSDNPKIVMIGLDLGILIVAWLFFRWRFRKEQTFFSDTPPVKGAVMNSSFGFVWFFLIMIGVLHLMVAWLQITGKLPSFHKGQADSDFKTLGFWGYVLTSGVFLPILKQYVATGFFFNYFFRSSSSGSTLLGIVFSGLIFGILQFQAFGLPLMMEIGFGMLFALLYLRLNRLTVPCVFAIFSQLLFILLG